MCIVAYITGYITALNSFRLSNGEMEKATMYVCIRSFVNKVYSFQFSMLHNSFHMDAINWMLKQSGIRYYYIRNTFN